MVKQCYLVIYNKVAVHRGITESPAPHRVLRTVRRVTVTSLRALVWVVYPDTKALGVIKVSKLAGVFNMYLNFFIQSYSSLTYDP